MKRLGVIVLIGLISKGCATANRSGPTKDPALLSQAVLALGCPAEQITAHVDDRDRWATVDGCGRLAELERKPDGSWKQLHGPITLGTDEVIDFGGGMTRPERLTGEDFAESLALRVPDNSLFIAKCVISRTGTVSDCRMLKPVCEIDAELLQTLQSWTFKPATFKGTPVSVRYVINVRLHQVRVPAKPPPIL